MSQELKERRRGDYPFFLDYRTRWIDNDQYSHINNSVYYHLFDSVVNTYLIQHASFSPMASNQIGLVVSSYSHFFSPLSFPAVLDLGLRVTKLGSSSVSYEIAVFEEGVAVPSVVGGYTHVFVDRHIRKSAIITPDTRSGLEKLQAPSSKL
ncbi:thioesterase [Lentinus brumalis]|uniref:Thioesterase n=1 Tax=Lentinus brumalis TaxID=2498619 RepID=A0A371CPS4_9APHY|nr:thioesterase [Polyporus brumalis]